MKNHLDETISDAKDALVPQKSPDWEAVDAKLFARIDAHERAAQDARVARLTSQPRAWRVVAGTLAAAAAVALVASKKPSGTFVAEHAGVAHAKASALVQRAGAGEVLVGGAPLANGAELRVGDVVETRGARAYLQRAGSEAGAPAAVAWVVEDTSRVTMEKAGASLVVALERGAVEAQVTPVPAGEAFAVDVAAPSGEVTRVAVHGTHLRVARVEGAAPGTNVRTVRLVVDLNEGVVSIGAPPRAGATVGTLVTAPAHVELDTADPRGTLLVSHVPGEVRAPADVAPPEPTMIASNARASGALRDAPAPEPRAPSGAATPPGKSAQSAPAPRQERTADPHAEETVARAVKDCMAARPAPESNAQVKVTVTSAMELHVGDDGGVELVKFDPPLPPDVQSCAATTIYKTRFATHGTIRIPLDF